MRGGVKLTQFHPEKKHQMLNIDETGDSDEEPSHSKSKDQKKKKMGWEEQLILRAKLEAAGKIEPLQPATVNDGGAYTQYNKMSRMEYQKFYNHFGTIGKIEDFTGSRDVSYDE